MDHQQFVSAMQELGINVAQCAKWMRVTNTTIINWRVGRTSVPGPAVTLMQEQLERERWRKQFSEGSAEWRAHCAKMNEIESVRSLTVRALKSKTWGARTNYAKVLGCDQRTFIDWLTARFKPGMTLENHGLWHLDHHVPLHSAADKADVARLAHYTNIKPMWRDKHHRKGKRIPFTNLLGEAVSRG